MRALTFTLLLATSTAAGAVTLDEALAHMRAGDSERAARELHALRAEGDSASLQLLEAICLFQSGERERAQPLFAQAQSDRELRPSAEFFLGMIDYDRGRSADAEQHFAAVERAGDLALRADAERMRRLADADAPVALSAAASSGFDSNVAVLPDGSRPQALGGDGFYGGDAALALRGDGGSAPFGRVAVGTRRYFELSDYDITTFSPSAGWRWRNEALRAELEYRYAFQWLADAPFSSIHAGRAALEYRSTHWRVPVEYVGRLESYLPSAARGYSGVRHSASLAPELRLGPFAIGVGYAGTDMEAAAPDDAYVQHSGTALARLQLGSVAWVELDGALSRRWYASAREDVIADGAATLHVDLGERWSAELRADGRQSTSTDPAGNYVDIIAGASLSYLFGI